MVKPADMLNSRDFGSHNPTSSVLWDTVRCSLTPLHGSHTWQQLSFLPLAVQVQPALNSWPSYTSVSSAPAPDTNKAARQGQCPCFPVRKDRAENLKGGNTSHLFAINIKPAYKSHIAKLYTNFENCSYSWLDAMTFMFSKACFWLCLHECK